MSLEIDQATLHKPEYCRVLLGCRNIHDLPHVAEGVLGDYFYDFYYEVDNIVVEGPAKQSGKTAVDSRNAPSPKRMRFEPSSSAEPSTNNSGFVSENSQSYDGVEGDKNYSRPLDTLPEHESEEDSEDDRELLIESMARERELDISNRKEGEGQEQLGDREKCMDKGRIGNQIDDMGVRKWKSLGVMLHLR